MGSDGIKAGRDSEGTRAMVMRGAERCYRQANTQRPETIATTIGPCFVYLYSLLCTTLLSRHTPETPRLTIGTATASLYINISTCTEPENYCMMPRYTLVLVLE
jgi:hypothetical protein